MIVYNLKDSRKSLNAGFTLIELLVVIAIISILAAILFPVFGRARENARRSSCQSNLKQLSLGVLQYQQDYDERYAPMLNVIGGNLLGWSQFVQPYVKSTQIFSCPSDTTSNLPASLATSANPSGFITLFPTSYSYNNLFTTANHPTYTAIATSIVRNPSETILITDGTSELGGNTNGPANKARQPGEWTELAGGHVLESYGSNFCFGAAPAASGSRGGPLARHLETTNVAFADGHVKAMKIEKWFNATSTCMTPATGCTP
jgi:prepilin-type N-terminal cleavage/methylation domain-containing protein/prepilin-type processing-associated H-X9-DG protein